MASEPLGEIDDEADDGGSGACVACVVCGSPIVVPPDAPTTARCPRHRDVAPPGKAHAPEPLSVSVPFPVFRINRVVAVNDGPMVTVDDTELFGCRIVAGQALVTLRHFDGQDDLALEIVDNVWRHGDVERFTIEHATRQLRISDDGAVIFELDVASMPFRLQARLKKSNVPILVRGGLLRVGETPVAFRGPTSADDGYAGCFVDVDTERPGVDMTPDPRHGGHAMTVTERDPVKRITMTLNAMSGLQAHIDAEPSSEAERARS